LEWQTEKKLTAILMPFKLQIAINMYRNILTIRQFLQDAVGSFEKRKENPNQRGIL
jgi:hypothetical protein